MAFQKSQSALEFLITYGWAFLVILITIGALAYFGVLNPSNFLPEKALVTPGFTVSEFQLYNDRIIIILKNNLPTSVEISKDIVINDRPYSAVKVFNKNSYPDFKSLPIVLSADDDAYFLFFGSPKISGDDGLVSDSKGEVVLSLQYRESGKKIWKSLNIELYGSVERKWLNGN